MGQGLCARARAGILAIPAGSEILRRARIAGGAKGTKKDPDQSWSGSGLKRSSGDQ
jgi:hypothetical protein